ncbi:hypothetical protein IG631_10916 [Alternaria alternata]|nr:hypothetical protein IG631_10916 [Alternaria alternata]
MAPRSHHRQRLLFKRMTLVSMLDAVVEVELPRSLPRTELAGNSWMHGDWSVLDVLPCRTYPRS